MRKWLAVQIGMDSFSPFWRIYRSRAYWLPANPPNTMHSDANTADKRIIVMVVELKNNPNPLQPVSDESQEDSSHRFAKRQQWLNPPNCYGQIAAV